MKDMTQGKPLKLIIGFAIPMLIGNIFQQVYNVADTVIVGRFLVGGCFFCWLGGAGWVWGVVWGVGWGGGAGIKSVWRRR